MGGRVSPLDLRPRDETIKATSKVLSPTKFNGSILRASSASASSQLLTVPNGIPQGGGWFRGVASGTWLGVVLVELIWVGDTDAFSPTSEKANICKHQMAALRG